MSQGLDIYEVEKLIKERMDASKVPEDGTVASVKVMHSYIYTRMPNPDGAG